MSDPYIPSAGFQKPIANYIACALAEGSLISIPILREPTIRQSMEIRQSWDALWDSHRAAILAFVRRPRREINRGIHRTVEQLTRHSLALQDDPNLGTTEEAIRSILPDLSKEIELLLSRPPFEPFGRTDAYVLALVKWFKSSYMKWIDPVPCPNCAGPTSSRGYAEPTSFERSEGAGRVELHSCNKRECGGQRRFCRYGKVSTLMRTREGRCGEFAHLFYDFLRAATLKDGEKVQARYIWNSEDHVWCEYWSDELKHWVHVDPSEGVTNKPLLYAKGWGKKQAFCLAFGAYGAEDVTRAYVDDWESCLGRRSAKGWREKELQIALLAHTVTFRLRMSEAERSRLGLMDEQQLQWINDEAGRLEEAERAEMSGRTSGPEEWRAMRDELGAADKSIVKPKIISSNPITVARSKLRMFGTAEFSGEEIVLTSASSQTGAVFHPTPISQTSNFRFDMTFRLTAPPGAGEADGIAVVFSPQPEMGEGGYGIGYSGLGGEGDFAVEIDTFRSQDHADDPPTPHISVHSPPHAHHRHSIACTNTNAIPLLSDGRDYTLELFYEGNSRRLRGYLEVPADDAGGKVEVEVCDVAIPSAEGERGHWYLGMTGSCGGLWQKQEIVKWSLEQVTFASESDTDTEGI